ncbi:MAG: hypothetical protein WA738_03240 [Candidatus Angelobacter sp.]
MKIHFSRIACWVLLVSGIVPVAASQARSGQNTVTVEQSGGTSGPPAVAEPQATPTPATISIAPPAEAPGIVQTAAKITAQTIVSRRKDPDDAAGRFGIASNKIALFAIAAAVSPAQAKGVSYVAPYIVAGETKRTDKQIGASGSGSGSTSAADKPGIPYLLGLALEHGAIAQNINGSTLTLSSSPYAVIAALKKEDTAETYNTYSGFTRIAVSASYNLQDQNDPLASVSRKQLSEWTVKFRLFGDHSARSKEAHDLFVAKVLPSLEKLANDKAKALSRNLDSYAKVFASFSAQTGQLIKDYLTNNSSDNDTTAEAKIADIIVKSVQQNLYGAIGTINLSPQNVQELSNFLVQYQADLTEYSHSADLLDQALKELDKKATLTFGYFNERGSGTPNYSVAKLMYEKKPGGFMQIDANLSASAYGNPDRTKNQQTFRDATAALQFQQNLGRSPFLVNSDDKSQISLAFAGRYERLQENRHVPGKKADIAIANWKLEIPIGAGVSLPLSITYANATELIKEQDVRGNFGITFDLDKLHTLVSPK